MIAAKRILPLHKQSSPAGQLAHFITNNLAKINKRPVGPEYSNRVRDRIHLRAPSTPKTLPKPIKSEPARAGVPRDER